MNERAIMGGALAVGVLAVGGLLLLSRRLNSLAPKIIAQTILAEQGGLPAQIKIDIQPSSALLKLAETGETWEYRVVDETARIYRKVINADEKTRAISVSLAYGRPVVAPRVEVWTDEGLVASAPLNDFPSPPAPHPMTLQRVGGLRAFHVPAEPPAQLDYEGNLNGRIAFESERPLAKNENWTIEILQTPFPKDPRHLGSTTLNGSSPAWSQLPFGEDITAIKVRVTRQLRHEMRGQIVFSDLRLVSRKGQTVLDWIDRNVPNSFGLDIRLVEKTAPPGSPTLMLPDRLQPEAEVKVEPLPNTLKPTEKFDYLTLQQDGTEAGRLNIRSLKIGSAIWFVGAKVSGPVETRPFRLTTTAVKSWTETLGSFEATIPVEPPRGSSVPVGAQKIQSAGESRTRGGRL